MSADSYGRARPIARRTRPVHVVALLLLLGALSAVAAGAAAGKPAPPPRLTATPLQPAEAIEVAKSKSGKLAQSDPALLGRSDSEQVKVVVKLDYDSAAVYEGTIEGLPATSPKKTGKKLKDNRAAVRRYLAHVAEVEREIVADIQGAVSGGSVYGSFQAVYGGIAMQLPADQIDELLAVDGVVAVQKDELRQPTTDVTPGFVGATSVWPSIGGSSTAGEGVIVGVLDTGIWPEHPSFADPGVSHPGGTFGCEFGDGSDPALGAPFTCNDKLIGAYAFTDTYMTFLDAVDGEFCDNATNECSARDSNGHGTHTASTAAGSPVAEAPLLGVDRGPVSGIAPGAHVIMYRVCLEQGCFTTDSVAAVEQAILDGADVLNFSISGGSNAYSDPVELAFLEAYENGILVNASAGNNGPGAGTANHAGPWTNTVGASTSDRHFISTLTLRADDGDTYVVDGASVTDGISTPTEIVRGGDVAGYNDEGCLNPLPPGSVTGKVVVCERGVIARVGKSFNVAQGGAAGLILYNPVLQGLATDNHFVPTVHLEGPPTELLAFLTTHTGIEASFTPGEAREVRGDVMAAFSSRGPLGDFLKPDVTAPGVQILAGNTPVPVNPAGGGGLPGQLFQAIQGTSMSSPHAAGVAALVRDVHPDWTPGQVKSALMTSSVQDVLKEDGSTATTPYDRGAGSIRANRAVNPTLTFDVDALDYWASAADPLNRIHLNLPSVNAAPLNGAVLTTRTGRNVTSEAQPFDLHVDAPAGARIEVSPKNPVAPAGGELELAILIDGTDLADGVHFGQITLDTKKPGYGDVVIPIAFNKQEGAIALTHGCADATIARGSSTACQVQAQNLAPVPATVDLRVSGPTNGKLQIRNVSAPGTPSGNGFTWSGTLSPALAPTITSITAGGSPAGYLPLSAFGIAPQPMGDESALNFNVPAFKYGSETYTRIGAVSNGYAVVGGAAAADVEFLPHAFPNPVRPNNVIAPYWTDLNLAAGGAFRAAFLAGGGITWLVLDWEDAPVWSNNAQRQSFQIWVRLGATESITWAYGPVAASDDPSNVGAENRDGTSGVNLPTPPASGTDFTVNTAPPTPGGAVNITYDAVGRNAGTFDVLASLTSDVTSGADTEKVTVTVTK